MLESKQPKQMLVYSCENGHLWKCTTYSKMEYLAGCPVCVELAVARGEVKKPAEAQITVSELKPKHLEFKHF